jgi:hypothetical protein
MTAQRQGFLVVRTGAVRAYQGHKVRVNGYGPQVHHGVVVGTQNHHIGFLVYAMVRSAQRPYVMSLSIATSAIQSESESANLTPVKVQGLQKPAQGRIPNYTIHPDFTASWRFITSSWHDFHLFVLFFNVHVYRFYVPGPVKIVSPLKKLVETSSFPIFHVGQEVCI